MSDPSKPLFKVQIKGQQLWHPKWIALSAFSDDAAEYKWLLNKFGCTSIEVGVEMGADTELEWYIIDADSIDTAIVHIKKGVQCGPTTPGPVNESFIVMRVGTIGKLRRRLLGALGHNVITVRDVDHKTTHLVGPDYAGAYREWNDFILKKRSGLQPPPPAVNIEVPIDVTFTHVFNDPAGS